MWLRGATAGIIVSLLAAGLYNFLYQDAFLKIFFYFLFYLYIKHDYCLRKTNQIQTEKEKKEQLNGSIQAKVTDF